MRLVKFRGKWAVYYRDSAGQPIRRSLGTDDRSEAERRFAEYQRLQLVRSSNPEGRTVKDIWNARRESLEGRRMSLNMKYSGLPIINFFGHLEPHHVNEDLCSQYIALRTSQGRKPWTIHTELSHLRSTLSWFRKRTVSLGLPPAPDGGFARLSAPPPKDLFLTKEQAKELLDACEQPHLRLYILLAISTGARNGALLDLTWDRVDLSRRLIELRTEDMVNKKGRATVPINNGLYEALRGSERHSEYVVHWGGQKVGSVKKALKKLARKAGFPWLSPHVFRHSAAVWMAESGVPMEEIAQFLGHSNVEITRRVYAKYSPDYLRNAAKALEL